MSDQRKGRLMLVSLVVVFALPLAIGMVLYVSGWRSGGQSYGELIEPAKTLNFSAVPAADSLVYGQGKDNRWHLFYITKGNCETECLENLQQMRKIHASLAKETGRLERVWVADGPVSDSQIGQLRAQYPDLVALDNAMALAVQFDVSGIPAAGSGNFYLVDPLGKLMMRYPRGADPAGIRKDLMKLLKYSWAG